MRIIVVGLGVEPRCSGELTSIISSALLLSHGIRRNVKLYVLFSKGYLYIDGRSVRNLRPDYESMCGLIHAALRGKTRYGVVYVNEEPSIVVNELFVLSSRGIHLAEALFSMGQGLGDKSIGLAVNAGEIVNAKRVTMVFFERDYCVSQVLTIFNYLLDLLGVET